MPFNQTVLGKYRNMAIKWLPLSLRRYHQQHIKMGEQFLYMVLTSQLRLRPLSLNNQHLFFSFNDWQNDTYKQLQEAKYK